VRLAKVIVRVICYVQIMHDTACKLRWNCHSIVQMFITCKFSINVTRFTVLSHLCQQDSFQYANAILVQQSHIKYSHLQLTCKSFIKSSFF